MSSNSFCRTTVNRATVCVSIPKRVLALLLTNIVPMVAAKTASASRAKAKPAAVAPAVVEDAAASLKRKRAGYSNVPGQTSVAAAPPPPVYATPAVPAASGPTTAPVVRQKTGKRGMTKSVLAGVRDPPTVAQQSNMRYDAGPNGTSGAGTTSVYPQPILSYLPAGYTLPGNGSMDMVNQTDPPVAGESLEERHFFDRVTEWIDDKFTYYEFLKLLNLYTQDLIDLPTLVSRAWLFIGNAPDLWADFREIVGWRDGAVIAGRTIENGEWIIENIPAIDRKTTDLTKMPAAGPSYRRLPAHVSCFICSRACLLSRRLQRTSIGTALAVTISAGRSLTMNGSQS